MTRLEQLRLDARLTREDLAERAGVSGRTIGRLENREQTTAHVKTLVALADALKARPSELLLPAHPERVA